MSPDVILITYILSYNVMMSSEVISDNAMPMVSCDIMMYPDTMSYYSKISSLMYSDVLMIL